MMSFSGFAKERFLGYSILKSMNTIALRKILDLEQRKYFNDTAVIGGLDRFVTNWSKQAIDSISTPAMLRKFRKLLDKPDYASLSPEKRAEWAKSVLEFLDEVEKGGNKAETGKKPLKKPPVPKEEVIIIKQNKKPAPVAKVKARLKISSVAGIDLEAPITVVKGISTALAEAGLGSSILPYYDANYLLNFIATRTDRPAEITFADLSYGGDSLLTRLGVQSGTYLGIDPMLYGGTAARTRKYVQNVTGIEGAIFERLRTGGAFDQQILNYQNSINRAEESLEAYETRLRNQFVALETQLAQINDVAQYVEAYLAAQVAAASSQNNYSSSS